MVGMTGVICSLALVIVALPSPLVAMLLMLAACAIPMWWMEYRRFSRPSPDRPLQSPASPKRRQFRLLGSAIVTVLLALSLFMQVHLGGPLTANLPDIIPLLLLAILTWTLWLAVYPMRSQSRDSVELLATATRDVLRTGRIDATGRQCILGWCVKAFFLPLMLVWLYGWLLQLDGELRTGHGWFSVFVIGMAILYALDTLFGTIGYFSTHRGIDAHIRSTDSTWLGWTSAVVCYPPLSMVVMRQWLDYSDGIDWTHWLGTSWLAFVWGVTILLLTAIYTSATLVFGPRFSNLTHRGIITAGPFRWTKHPAYISKNLSWWLIAVPFVSEQGAAAAALSCLALLGVNAIYWLRAKTEERHLMRDPVYQQYASWIAENGLFARCLRCVRLRPAQV